MKNDKKPDKIQKFLNGLLNFFLEVFGDFFVYGIFFAVGLGIVLLLGLIPMELDPEVIILLGIFAVGIIVFLVYLLVTFFKKRKNK